MVVNGEVWSLYRELEQIASACEVQSSRFGEFSGPDLEDVGDVVGAYGVEFHRVGNGGRHSLFTVDFG